MSVKHCFYVFVTAASIGLVVSECSQAFGGEFDSRLAKFMGSKCLDCHTGKSAEAGFDLSQMLDRGLTQENLNAWALIYDRVQAGEMPPDNSVTEEQRSEFTRTLFPILVDFDKQLIAARGRTTLRRLNRYEYENTLRELLDAPWLQLKTMLPEDGELFRFNKVSEALDVSHVNMARYMQAADYALRQVISDRLDAPTSKITRYYAREQASFNRKTHYTVFNRSPERAVFPLIDYAPDLAVLRDDKHPFTVGEANPEQREREAFGVVASSYEPIEPRFSDFKAPRSGRYKLRFKGYTFWAEGEEKKWWRPDREKTSIGRRSEPVVIYSELPPRQLRRIGEFDFQIQPSVQELDVYLLEGETIQPDAVRLFRSRPSNWHNPLAEEDGMPGVAFSYLEVEGPILESWPTAGHQLLFDTLPSARVQGTYQVVSNDTTVDVDRLIRRFLTKAYRRTVSEEDAKRFTAVAKNALSKGHSFQESMIAAYVAALCSPDFICVTEPVGKLDALSVASRLSLFLWNSQPDESLIELVERNAIGDPTSLRDQVRSMLDHPNSRRFVDAFLAYWLDLRKANDTSPDEILYPDYYLDDSLVDASLEETQLFLNEVIQKNLSVGTFIDSDFTFVNERLSKHYEFPLFEGTHLRKVSIPPDSPRGGLLTQASVLKVTANGTTTSPVLRGVWVNERILGTKIPPPPKSVPAIEPDTRGATTIRRQLELHRADASCAGCHSKIDPVGFALESFDVSGGWRTHYRSLNEDGEKILGFGKNGQPFTFRKGPAVDASGILPSGEEFKDIFELKTLLLKNQRGLARNLLNQLLVYSTGSSPRFSDRVEVERMLDRLEPDGFPVRSMIEEIVCSPMFLNK